MRLKTYLRSECSRLAGVEGFNVRRLLSAALTDSPRVAEPLLLACVACGSSERLLELSAGTPLEGAYEGVSGALSQVGDLEQAVRDDALPDGLPREYRKHLDSWLAVWSAPERRAEAKGRYLERIRLLQAEKGISNAEICRTLGVNEGNLCAFLKHGDLDKLSRERAAAVMRYLATA